MNSEHSGTIYKGYSVQRNNQALEITEKGVIVITKFSIRTGFYQGLNSQGRSGEIKKILL